MRTCTLATGGIAACVLAVILLVFQICTKFVPNLESDGSKIGTNSELNDSKNTCI